MPPVRAWLQPCRKIPSADAASAAAVRPQGFLEASGPAGELFGEERLSAAIASSASPSAEHAADAILSQLTAWSRQGTSPTQDDDLTLLLIDL